MSEDKANILGIFVGLFGAENVGHFPAAKVASH